MVLIQNNSVRQWNDFNNYKAAHEFDQSEIHEMKHNETHIKSETLSSGDDALCFSRLHAFYVSVITHAAEQRLAGGMTAGAQPTVRRIQRRGKQC